MYGLRQTTATYGSPGFPPAGEREGGYFYLGNITHQVNTSNVVVAEYSFDAWGRRRNPNSWNYDLTNQPELFAERGFTGHEHLKWFNLVNMNGRLYDPLVGRFLSADPVIQNAGFTQNYNRYSYCLNNPLKFTDPSGYRMAAADEYRNLGNEFNYFSNFNHFSPTGDNGGGGGGVLPGWANGAYNYDYNTGAYTNSSGDIVPFSEVFSKYIVPNSSERYTITETAYSLDGGITFTGNGNYSLVRLGRGVESTGLYDTYTGVTSGGGANAWDYISNGASVASAYPTISGTWSYNNSGGDVRWTGKNGNYYKFSQVKNNGGYVKSLNYAKNASRLTRGLGNGLTGLSVVTNVVSTSIAVANGRDNTSTWIGFGVTAVGAAVTVFGAPIWVTGAAIGGAAYGVGQIFYGDEINGWIDRNAGFEGGILKQLGY